MYKNTNFNHKKERKLKKMDYLNFEKQHCCCFCGHRKINNTKELQNKIYVVIEKLITDYNVDTFLFGSRSEFDAICYEIVTKLKKIYYHIKRIYIRAEYPDISESYTEFLLKNYEATYYPKKLRNAGKASYVERNREMIDKSDFCIIYYDENYKPPKRYYNSRILSSYQPKSGTHIAYTYAKRKKLKVINIINDTINI